jgi:hypothetical protein
MFATSPAVSAALGQAGCFAHILSELCSARLPRPALLGESVRSRCDRQPTRREGEAGRLGLAEELEQEVVDALRSVELHPVTGTLNAGIAPWPCHMVG